MISEEQFQNELDLIIANAVREDVGDGDHSSLSCIPASAQGRAKLLVKDEGIIAGVAFAKQVFNYVDPNLTMEILMEDGAQVKYGDIVFYVEGSSQSILKAERLVLNAMQRMSAIATKTQDFVSLLDGTDTKILDTRKTTPGIRALEKWAVKIGGGENHRFALYDMVMLKDNHLAAFGEDLMGATAKAVAQSRRTNPGLLVEMEVDRLEQISAALKAEVDIILLDNFSVPDLRRAKELIGDQAVTEISGNVTLDTLQDLTPLGCDFISTGALVHKSVWVDIGLDWNE